MKPSSAARRRKPRKSRLRQRSPRPARKRPRNNTADRIELPRHFPRSNPRDAVERSSPYADRTDEELLALFRQGTHEAFGALVRRYEGVLYGYLRRYLGNSDLAD